MVWESLILFVHAIMSYVVMKSVYLAKEVVEAASTWRMSMAGWVGSLVDIDVFKFIKAVLQFELGKTRLKQLFTILSFWPSFFGLRPFSFLAVNGEKRKHVRDMGIICSGMAL